MKQHRNPLGHDPLSAGIFTKTQVDELTESPADDQKTINHKPASINQNTETINHKPEYGSQELRTESQSVMEEIQEPAESPWHPETINHKPASINQNTETINNKPDSGLLLDGPKEKITLQFPTYLNEWLDDLIRNGKRRHGQKIQKQVWFQAAFELMKSLPVEWEDVNSTDKLKEELEFWITQLASSSNQNHKP